MPIRWLRTQPHSTSSRTSDMRCVRRLMGRNLPQWRSTSAQGRRRKTASWRSGSKWASLCPIQRTWVRTCLEDTMIEDVVPHKGKWMMAGCHAGRRVLIAAVPRVPVCFNYHLVPSMTMTRGSSNEGSSFSPVADRSSLNRKMDPASNCQLRSIRRYHLGSSRSSSAPRYNLHDFTTQQLAYLQLRL